MDKLLYIAASGASQDLLGTGIRANNLANAQTTGFRAQLEQARLFMEGVGFQDDPPACKVEIEIE